MAANIRLKTYLATGYPKKFSGKEERETRKAYPGSYDYRRTFRFERLP